MSLDPDDGLWDNFLNHFDEVMQLFEVPSDQVEWMKEWKSGAKSQLQISEDYDIELPQVRNSIMIVLLKLRKHLGIIKSDGNV